MVGQVRLLKDIDRIIENGTYPRFSILVGEKGSGRKLLADQISKTFGYTVVKNGLAVADIRAMIDNSYKITNPLFYILPDADNMSANAKNALLKVTEEPPNNAYFLMTLEDENNTLETIRSRATIFYMDKYTRDELKQYAKDQQVEEEDWLIIQELVETPGDINNLIQYNVKEFYDFVFKTVENIAIASGANVFKLAEKLKLKDDGEGYDLKLFFRAFMSICKNKFTETSNMQYIKGIGITSDYMKDLRITGISKAGVVDLWILDIRREWM